MTDRSHSFIRGEIGPVIVCSLISALRLLGIFLMLPIFSAYAVRYPGASPAWRLGLRHLCPQCIFQIPGLGQRRGGGVDLMIGLALFSVGSIACGLATNITTASPGAARQRAVRFGRHGGTHDVTAQCAQTFTITVSPSVRPSHRALSRSVLARPHRSRRFFVLALLALLSMLLTATSFPPESAVTVGMPIGRSSPIATCGRFSSPPSFCRALSICFSSLILLVGPPSAWRKRNSGKFI